MLSLKALLYSVMLSLFISPAFAKKEDNSCCGAMGGVNYCDSSAGRLVCNNGFYSTCYCTPHAVMDLQLLRGCCLWKGGVLPPSVRAPTGVVVCNDGSISEECSLQNPQQKIAAW
jgi:hypothetical protein